MTRFTSARRDGPPGLLERWRTPLVLATLLVAALHVVAMVAVRPMFQVSDEVAYFAGVQLGALKQASGDGMFRARLAPPDGTVESYAAGKPLFQRTAGYLYLVLASHATPATAAVLLRLLLGLSVIVTVGCTYLLARHVAPGDWLVALGAPQLVAMHSVFVTYGAGITPDSIANACATAALWLLVRFASGTSRALEPFALVALAIVAFLFKDTAVFLFAGLAFALLARAATVGERLGSVRAALRHDPWLAAASLLAVVSPLVLLASRPRQVLLHSASLRAFSEQLRTGVPAHAAYEPRFLVDYLQPVTVFKSFWGALANFGGNDVVLPDSVLFLLAVACALGAAGLVLYVSSPLPSTPRSSMVATRRQLFVLLGCSAVIALQAPTRDLVLGIQGALQGRWLFPMIGPFMVMLCLGWSRLVRGQPRALPLVAFVSGTIGVYALACVILPAFYDSFPGTYRDGSLFLSGPFGLSIEPSRLMLFVRRPAWLQSGWVAGIPVAAFAVTAFGWPTWVYAIMRRADRAARERTGVLNATHSTRPANSPDRA